MTCLIIWSFRICVRRNQDIPQEPVSDHHHKDVINETWILEPFPNSIEIEDPEQDEMIKEPVKEPYYGLDIIANWKTKDSYMNFVEPIGYIDPEPELTNPYLPDLPDIRHYKCLLHLNWQRRIIFYGNSLWLVILWCCGVLQLLKTLAVVMLKPLRVFRLEQQGGKLRSKLKLCHIANQMDYADYMVALGLGSRMTTSTFNEFVVALYNRLVPVPDVDGDLEDNQQDQETIQLNQFDNTEDGHLASVQQCDD